jgi:hypothetical protein
MEFNKDDMDERNGPTVLRFEAKWLKEAHFRQVVEDSWEQAGLGSQRTSLAGKLAFVHDQLHKWDRSILQKSKKSIRKAQRNLEKISREPLTDENIEEQRMIAKEIEDMLEKEEIHWAQRSRINWLQHGDKNTSYFHHFANERKKRNRIKKLKDDSGAWVEGVADLNPLVSDYFAGLFTSEIEEPDPDIIDKVNPKVDDRMNEQLLKPFTADDVKKALFSIGDMKAPGADGLHAIFFKKCWNILGEVLTEEVLGAINNKSIPEGWNDTVIILIPKVDNPESVMQYRPISLCNVLYKVISKMFAL